MVKELKVRRAAKSSAIVVRDPRERISLRTVLQSVAGSSRHYSSDQHACSRSRRIDSGMVPDTNSAVCPTTPASGPRNFIVEGDCSTADLSVFPDGAKTPRPRIIKTSTQRRLVGVDAHRIRVAGGPKTEFLK